MLDTDAQRADVFATDNDAVIARFASAIEQFDTDASWWSRLLGTSEEMRRVSLKKTDIFPIVHGVRGGAGAACQCHQHC